MTPRVQSFKTCPNSMPNVSGGAAPVLPGTGRPGPPPRPGRPPTATEHRPPERGDSMSRIDRLVNARPAGRPDPDRVVSRHQYQRDSQSGAGNCWCGRHEGHRMHQWSDPRDERPRVQQQNPDGTWSEAIPEPFWVRRWFRWRPACWPCSMRTDALPDIWPSRSSRLVFRDRAEWEQHYRACPNR